jgi:hypothetical protein
MTRATRATQQRRADDCRELLERGYSRHKIHTWVHQKASQLGGEYWILQERQIDAYVARAHSEISAEANVDRHFEKGRALSRLNTQYAKARVDGNDSLALKIQCEIDRLLGLGQADEASEQPDREARRAALLLELAKLIDEGKGDDGQR